jgi:hypothetical protein
MRTSPIQKTRFPISLFAQSPCSVTPNGRLVLEQAMAMLAASAASRFE